jgi:hypothetical protein
MRSTKFRQKAKSTSKLPRYETSEKLAFIVAAVGRPPHFFSKLKCAALCREAATPVSQRSQNVKKAAGEFRGFVR